MRALRNDFLAEMARASRARAILLRPRAAELARAARAAPPAPPLCLTAGFDMIAEVKFAAPSSGALAAPSATEARARGRQYARAGAAAISVLTEPTRFQGDPAHLTAVARAVAVPVLRKDFLLDPLQLLEARALGAGGVLLILALLGEKECANLLALAAELGLFVLLETCEREELACARELLEHRPELVGVLGVNARDLHTLRVDPARFEHLAPDLPRGLPAVAESGLESAREVRRVAELGYRAALIGRALMAEADPSARLRALLAAGRAGRPT